MAGGAATTTNLSFMGAGQLGANAGSAPGAKAIAASAAASRSTTSSAAKGSQTATMQKVQSTAASIAARFGRR